jgi:hypothetical protein
MRQSRPWRPELSPERARRSLTAAKQSSCGHASSRRSAVEGTEQTHGRNQGNNAGHGHGHDHGHGDDYDHHPSLQPDASPCFGKGPLSGTFHASDSLVARLGSWLPLASLVRQQLGSIH